MASDSFTQLVDAHYRSLYRFALSLCRNSADACDLTQQTFFVWASKGGELRDVTKVKSWLFTTLYREFLKVRTRGQRTTAIEDLPPGEKDPPADPVDYVQRLDAASVVEAIQRIDEVFRAPLTLFYLQELSYQEIAHTLEIPIGTVMSRLSRGKEQLKRALLDASAMARRGAVVPFPRFGEEGSS